MKNFFENPFKGKLLSEQVTNSNIIVGRYSYYSGYYHGHSFDDCARYLMPDNKDVDKLIIGSFCSIGSGVSFIMAGNQGHRMEWTSTFPFHYMKEEPLFAAAADGYKPAGNTVVGNDVWIGAEAIVMPGVHIGHGAVIGTRAVIAKDVEPYTVVAGNPARLIRNRFNETETMMLLEMRWWDWSDEHLKGAMSIMTGAPVADLYDYWRSNVLKA
ncbi:Chloramphenicol acetyltransferase [compost metagenome]